ncbi:MAG TPA: hypothetical protein VKX33_06200 [Cyclobacteriaceae bacterium]|nr:hypothetical protein [Cyclobacteriaceae bacterium]
MNKLISIRFLGAIAILGLASCSTNYSALKGESDDLYFMASDAKVATEFAVQNNNRENFKQLEQINAEEYTQENFSAKNVNPEYLAKYQGNNTSSADDGTVYFDEAGTTTAAGEGGDINVYNNFRGNSGYNNFNSWNMNPWMMSSMYMGGFSPWGMGSFYDPFWNPGFGFRPGFNLSLGLGFGFGNRFGMGFGNPWRYGYGMGYYDPFYSPYYGYGYNRPIIIIPGGSENQRRIVRGARPSRSSLATTGRSRDNVSTASTRTSARRDAVARTSTPATRANTRSDFSRSQNDYYNANSRNASAASAAPIRRSTNSPAVNRTGSATNRENYTSPSRTIRSQSPSVNTRGTSTESRSRYAAPSRNSSPSYNRSSSPQYNRTTTPSNNSRSTYSTPTRSSSPSYSAPSRSSGSSGGAVRSSGGSSRRGN